MKAVGAYIETLREGRGLSRVWAAEKAGTNDTSVYRVERKGQQPGPKILIGLIRAIRGSFEDVDELLRDDDLPTEVGVRLAQERLSKETVAMIDGAIDRMGQEEARQLADKLMSDPAFFADFLREVAERGKRRP